MTLVKVGSKHQVVIPKEIREKLGVIAGDYVEVAFRHNQAVIKRKKMTDEVPYTDEPLGPKARAGLRRGLKDVAEGKIVGPFQTPADLRKHLDSLKK